jgi:hypothetical protein
MAHPIAHPDLGRSPPLLLFTRVQLGRQPFIEGAYTAALSGDDRWKGVVYKHAAKKLQ